MSSFAVLGKGAQGPQGEPGPTGPEGPEGPPGPEGTVPLPTVTLIADTLTYDQKTTVLFQYMGRTAETDSITGTHVVKAEAAYKLASFDFDGGTYQTVLGVDSFHLKDEQVSYTFPVCDKLTMLKQDATPVVLKFWTNASLVGNGRCAVPTGNIYLEGQLAGRTSPYTTGDIIVVASVKEIHLVDGCAEVTVSMSEFHLEDNSWAPGFLPTVGEDLALLVLGIYADASTCEDVAGLTHVGEVVV